MAPHVCARGIAASFPLFLTALLILAAGITGLQVAANPYVIVLGKPETASSRLNLTQAFNSLGTTLAPVLGGMFILSAAPLAPNSCINSRLKPCTRSYAPGCLGQDAVYRHSIVLILLAVAIAKSKLPKIEHEEARPGEKINDSIWKHPNLLFGALGIFAYVGAEVSIGSFMVNYLGQPEIAGFSPQIAAGYVSFYWGGAMVGRFIGARFCRGLRPGSACGVCGLYRDARHRLNAHERPRGDVEHDRGRVLQLHHVPEHLRPGRRRAGPLTGTGSGLINMAIVGGAIIPLIQGAIADHIGIHHAFILPVICYLYIVFYALRGSTPNSERYGNAGRRGGWPMLLSR